MPKVAVVTEDGLISIFNRSFDVHMAVLSSCVNSLDSRQRNSEEIAAILREGRWEVSQKCQFRLCNTHNLLGVSDKVEKFCSLRGC